MSDETVDKNEELSEDQIKEKKSKDKKKFEDALRFVSALVGGEDNLKPVKKVKGDQAATLVAKLFKEKNDKLKEEFSKSLAILLEKYLEMKAEVAKKQKELDDLTAKKEKEFTKSVNDWKSRVEQSEIMNSSYVEALRLAFTKEAEEKKD